jgi:ribonucrease Y
MSNLETLVSTIPGVSKAYIMQAGREIMAFYSPTDVRDEDVESLTVDIAKKIEDQLDYPGSIRIVGIREQRVTQYLR